jgi:chaperonin GroEL
MAEDIEREALSTLILNKVKGIVDVVAVRIPGIGDAKQAFLEDIAVLTNATIISDKIGLSLKNTSLSMMGSAKSMIVSKDMTTIVSDINQEAVNLRCTSLKKQIELSVNSYEKQKLQDRLAKLSGGIAIIKLGAYTEVEMIENKLRFEDAIHATKAALEEGIIPGGGAALLHLSSDLNSWAKKSLVLDEYLGAEIIMKALWAPLFTILDNAGTNGPLVVESLRGTSFEIGYDAEKYQIANMYSVGIIDPAKVTRLALQNASSIACIILTTECLVSDIS